MGQAGAAARRTVGLIPLLCLALLSPRHASACTCVDSYSLSERIKKYHTIFMGEALAQVTGQPGWSDVTFRVVRMWKGEEKSDVVVRTAVSAEACGYSFKTGHYYVVFAYLEGPVLGSNRCTPTELATRAKSMARDLDRHFRVKTPIPEEQSDP